MNSWVLPGATLQSTSAAGTPRCFFQQSIPLDSGDRGTETLLGPFVKPQQQAPTGCLAHFQLTGKHKLRTTLSVVRAMAQVPLFFQELSLPSQSFILRCVLRFPHHLSAAASSTRFFQSHSICYALCSLLSSLLPTFRSVTLTMAHETNERTPKSCVLKV